MRMPTALKSLDDKVLGRRGEHDDHEPYPEEPRGETEGDTGETEPREQKRSSTGDGLREFLAVFLRISKLVFYALAAILVLGIVFVLAPTNADNVIVDLVTDVSNAVAGPFRDIFTISDNADRETVVNFAFAAVVYVVLGKLMNKLQPTKQ